MTLSSSWPLRLHLSTLLSPAHDAPCTNDVVRIACKQRLPIGTPSQTHTLGFPALLALNGELGLQFIDLALLLEIENDDGTRGGGAEPVAVGGEDKGMDLVTGGKGVEVLGLVQIPEHGRAVLATRGTEGAVGRDGDGVDVAGVTDVVGLDAARSEFPDLWKLSEHFHGVTHEEHGQIAQG